MKPKTARRILKKRAWEIAERNINGSLKYKKWLGRLEAKCRQIVAEDKMEKALGRRHMS